MLTSPLVLLRRCAHREALRWRESVRHARRPTVERLENYLLLANSPILVTNTSSSGPGSLDAAIRLADSNNSATITPIDFDIPGAPGQVQTILIGDGTGSRLQTIHVPILLDGWSEGDFENHTTPGAGTYQGSPLIVLDGTNVQTSVGAGLDFAGASGTSGGSSGSVVQGLDLINWKFVAAQNSGGTAIEIEGGFTGGNSPAAHVTIQGSYIGVGPDGMTVDGNDAYGILVQGNNNTIGGTTAATRNVIAGNGNNAPSFEAGAGVGVYPASESVSGITVTGSSPTGNIIEGNNIGVAADGSTQVPNATGVLVGLTGTTTTGTTIGGSTSAAGNIISGNQDDGIELKSASATTIQSNVIGTDAAGVNPVGNGGNAIDNINSDHTTIGGPGGVPAPGNLIAYDNAILLTGSNSTQALIQGNTIGIAGQITFDKGIEFQNGANRNTVGGTAAGDGNIIQFAASAGVAVGLTGSDTTTVGNTIEGNSIFSSRGLGIDLDTPLSAPTTNQTGTTVTPGPNDFQNYPVLTSIVTNNGTTTVTGTFDEPAEPSTTLRIEFFGDVGSSSNHGQGQTFLGFTPVTTDGNGHAAFTNVPVSSVPVGDLVSATATVVSTSAPGITVGDTSEFSADLAPTTPPATKLVVTAEPPSSVVSDANFSFTVVAEDDAGTADASFNGPVNVAIMTGPSGGFLNNGVTTLNAVNGVVTFSFGLNVAGGPYTLVVTSGTLTQATTTNITVTPAPGSVLQLTTPPPRSVSVNSKFSMVVAVTDRAGNVDPTYNQSVNVILEFAPTGATLGGTTSLIPTNGVADFSDLTLDTVGTYDFQVESGRLDTLFDISFDVTPVGVAQLAVTTEPPGSIAAGSPFSLAVSAEDASGSVDTSYSGSVVLALASGTGTLGGTTMVNAVNGVASFSGLSLSPTGTYTIGATSGNLTPATTTPVNVPVIPTQLVVTTEPPTSTGLGVPFGLAVSAEDAAGNVDASYTGTVVLALASGPGTLGGTLMASAVNGVATFSGLTLSPAGSDTIQATSGNLSPATTTAINVSLTPTSTTLSSSANPSAFGQPVTFTAIVSPATDGPVTPTGSVTFSIDGISQTPVPLSLIGNQVGATFPDDSLAAGSHTIGATYSGDSVFAMSPATALTQVVQAATSTTLTAAPTASAGQTVTLTATVSGSGSAPTGTVTFLDGQTLLGTAPVDADDQATLPVSTLAVGAHAITASYAGDADNLPSQSAGASVTINAVPTATTLNVPPTSGTFGQPVTLSAVVASAGSSTPRQAA